MEERNKAIRDTERQMVELAQLFQDLDQILQQQEPLVADVERNGDDVRENITKGNEEVITAITTARARNRKKWWCLLVVLLVVITIAVVVGAVVTINNKKL